MCGRRDEYDLPGTTLPYGGEEQTGVRGGNGKSVASAPVHVGRTGVPKN